jgi:A/G-specific adenine glycosylase
LINTKNFADRLVAWYEHHKRDLPWRHTRDPYRIWLSEVILQQTRVKQGLPYYEAFIERFPTVFDLAAASEQEILRLWQGLGYYSRARNMQYTAQLLVNQYNGVFPADSVGLLKLKGIGTYTAAAIASFAFDEKVAVLDGNVYRVLARLFGIETDIATHQAKSEFAKLANQLISSHQPSLYNQAIMDFGAIQCTPTSPDCLLCPFQQECEAYLSGRQAKLPVKNKKVTVKNRFFHYVVFTFQGKIAMRHRTEKDIWQGLYDFPLVENGAALETAAMVRMPEFLALTLGENIPENSILEMSQTYLHVLTHQRVAARFLKIRLGEPTELPAHVRFYDAEQAAALPKPVLIDKYLSEHFF